MRAFNKKNEADRFSRSVIVGVLAFGGVSVAGPAIAQSTKVKEPDLVVVTALRRPVDLSELAGNASTLTAAEIDFIGADHPAEALSRLPGVYIHRGNGQEHLTAVRSPVLTGGAGAGSFLYLEDGVPMRAAGFSNVNGLFESMSEVAGGVEVVRGPGSALYGSNAVHGLVNVLTRGPDLDNPFTAEISGGSFERLSGRLFASHGKTGAGEAISVSLTHEGGYIRDAGLDMQKVNFVSERGVGEGAVRLSVSAFNLNQETAGFIQGVDAYKDRTQARINPEPTAFRDALGVRAAAAYTRKLAPGQTLSITPYVRYNEMEFLQHFLPSDALEKNGHWSVGSLVNHEWALSAGHRILIGVDTEYTEGFYDEFQSLPDTAFPPPYPQGEHYDFTVVSQVAAPYIHTQWQVSENLRLTAEARYELTRYDYDTDATPGINGRINVPADREDTFEAFTPALGAVYSLDDRSQLYARYARGARAPQITDAYRLQLNQVVGEIEEEELNSFELGLRRSSANVSFNLAGFLMDKDNFFFRDADGLNVTDGNTRHMGIEIDGLVRLSNQIAVTGSATYAKHTYRFDRKVASTSNATEAISKGDDVDSAPRRMADIQLNWTPSDAVKLEAEWVHIGRYFTDASNEHTYPGHDLFHLRGAWQANDNWSIGAAVRNLLDEDYAERADFAFGNERYFPGETRSFEVRLLYTR